MKLSTLFATSILLCIFVASFSVISPVSAAPWPRISGSQCTDHNIADDHYAVYGEITNIGDQPATLISFTVIARDEFGGGGGTGTDIGNPVIVELNTPIVLHPDESWPWEAHFLQAAMVDANDFNIQDPIFSATDALPTGLEIVSHSSDSPGVVDGEVQNIGTEATTNIEVGASFYSAAGPVLATAFTEIAGPLNPGENATFSIDLANTDLAPILGEVLPLIDSYVVTAQSQEYAIIPEFHIWTSMLLILIVLTAAIAIYKRRLLKTPTL
ncbi:MAG: FxLYD domain-containing protein [Candidatus Bathyarchaeota archaeon]|nr:FxLYD domain-containing protein [Candidatus Bathyarchaeota archaeon]